MVSALGYERSEPGFESRRPESNFSSTHQKKRRKNQQYPSSDNYTRTQNLSRYLSRPPHIYNRLATINLDEAQQLSRTIYHLIPYNEIDRNATKF